MVGDHLGPGDSFQNVGVIVVLGYDEHFAVPRFALCPVNVIDRMGEVLNEWHPL